MKLSMDRNLALETVRVTEWAALASARWMGRGDEKAADQAAVDAMRTALNGLSIQGTIVIGEGERDEAPMLYIGEEVGKDDAFKEHYPHVDIALDPLEGTTITAHGLPNAMTVIAIAEQGGFLNAPDVYMQKIAVGAGLPADLVDLDLSATENITRLAQATGKRTEDVVVCILDRPRHKDLVQEIRDLGTRIHFIADGDVSAVIACSEPNSGIDMYIGTGGAPEGVLAAAALQCIGGFMQGRLLFRNDDEKQRAAKYGITDLDHKYSLDELAHGNVMFAATGVTDGTLLRGVKMTASGAKTQSVVMRSNSGTVRKIEATHDFRRKPFDTV